MAVFPESEGIERLDFWRTWGISGWLVDMADAGDSSLSRLTEFRVDDPVLQPPSATVDAPVDPLLDLLPTGDMSWPNFERLLLRVAREVQGLRAVKTFGDPGQAQMGLDVVGINPENKPEGIQSKRYATFTVADLNNAVDKYLSSDLPFTLAKLAIGVSRRTNERKIVERLIALNVAHKPIEIELWDQDRLSELLRDRPDIVIEFFGTQTAARFCLPHRLSTIPVPSSNLTGTADAVVLGPTEVGRARDAIKEAESLRETNPELALRSLKEAQNFLTVGGFVAHAAALDEETTQLLVHLGRRDEAIRGLADRFWESLVNDDLADAESNRRALAKVVSEPLASQTEAEPISPSHLALRDLVDAVLDRIQHPLPGSSDLNAIASANAPLEDRARSLLFFAESAVSDDDPEWVRSHSDEIADIASQMGPVDIEISIRLRLTAADSDHDWKELLAIARKRLVPRPTCALILARHARDLAIHGDYADADASWAEAVEQGCLARHNEDAADWIYSRRRLATRYTVFLKDDFHPLGRALNRLPSEARIATGATRTRERALEALQDDRLRSAAIHLRRYLRDSVVSASWEDELGARVLLADVYARSGEAAIAAHHLITAGDAKRARLLAESLGDEYLDVRPFLASPTYWTVAAAFEFVAVQNDVVPDAHVSSILNSALDVLDKAKAGTLIDAPLFGPHVYLSAHKALASLASRSTITQARRLLRHLKPFTFAEEGHYRHTDESHAKACSSIARLHERVRKEALKQLVALLARAPHVVKTPGRDVLVENLDLIGNDLKELAHLGNRDALELLAVASPEKVDRQKANDAAAALVAPTDNSEGHYSMGTDAISQSILARTLPASQRTECIRALLSRTQSPFEGASNRIELLLAATNLADGLPAKAVDEFLPISLRLAGHQPESQADTLQQQMNHPLGAMRWNDESDSRPAAVFLAASLARNAAQRRLVRDIALQSVGVDHDADYYVTRALQELQSELGEYVPFLIRHGWALRSLAAIVWSKTTSLSYEVGEALAADPDPRVRRALANAVGSDSSERTAAAREHLAADPCYSVRTIVTPSA